MIKSMTGYGSAQGSVEGLRITVELKSVNNRFLDASVRLPRRFLFAEKRSRFRREHRLEAQYRAKRLHDKFGRRQSDRYGLFVAQVGA